jgi:hypothetical protein
LAAYVEDSQVLTVLAQQYDRADKPDQDYAESCGQDVI